jgi:hypothetical protein
VKNALVVKVAKAPQGTQVHHALRTAGKAASGCLIVLAFAAVAIMGANVGLRMSAGTLRSAVPAVLPAVSDDRSAVEERSEAAVAATPVEILAARFPSEEPVSQPPTFSTATVIPSEQGETFDLAAVAGMATVEPPWPSADGTAPAHGPGAAPELSSEAAKALAAGASRRASARSPYVVNDGMIASIRRRLKLSAEQQKLWPPVEAALRKIVYTPAAMTPQRGGGATAYIDATSAEVRELKSAAFPLLLRLNEEQKHEVRELVHVMGLESLASQF